MNSLDTAELWWCVVSLASQLMQRKRSLQCYHATVSKAVTEMDKQQSYYECPSVLGIHVTTAAWRQIPESWLHWYSSLKAVRFWQFPNMVYAQPKVTVTGPLQHWKDWWAIVAHSVLTSIREIVCFFILSCAAVPGLSLFISLWILTPASFCCKMVWSWPPSGRDQRQLLPWLTSRYLEKGARERINEQWHISYCTTAA